MKAITAERHWQPMAFKQIKNLIELAVYRYKTLAGINRPVMLPVTAEAAETTTSTPAVDSTPNITDSGNNNLFVLFGIQPSWTIDTIGDQLRELKHSFGSCSKVIVCSELYMDELVHRSEEFDYDAYLLTCDGRDEFRKALCNVQSGKMYLSKSVITSYCITRRKEWGS